MMNALQVQSWVSAFLLRGAVLLSGLRTLKKGGSVTSRQLIRDKARHLADDIREWSRSQIDFWRRVPYLALEADGRSGFSDTLLRAYHDGYWALEASAKNGTYDVMVDLATGELVSSWDLTKPASDAGVLKLAVHLDELDAKALRDELQDQAKEPYPSYYKPEEQEAWRKAKHEELRLERMYVRKNSPKEVTARWLGNSLAD